MQWMILVIIMYGVLLLVISCASEFYWKERIQILDPVKKVIYLVDA